GLPRPAPRLAVGLSGNPAPARRLAGASPRPFLGLGAGSHGGPRPPGRGPRLGRRPSSALDGLAPARLVAHRGGAPSLAGPPQLEAAPGPGDLKSRALQRPRTSSSVSRTAIVSSSGMRGLSGSPSDRQRMTAGASGW